MLNKSHVSSLLKMVTGKSALSTKAVDIQDVVLGAGDKVQINQIGTHQVPTWEIVGFADAKVWQASSTDQRDWDKLGIFFEDHPLKNCPAAILILRSGANKGTQYRITTANQVVDWMRAAQDFKATLEREHGGFNTKVIR